jgi:class 3 adenylate cyclase
MVKIKEPLISKTYSRSTPNLWKNLSGEQQPSGGNLLFSPVFAGLDNQEIIGSVVFDMDFTFLIGSDVPLGSEGVLVVLDNSCGQKYTYRSDGTTVHFVGDGDLHDPNFSNMIQQSDYSEYTQIPRGLNPTHPNDSTDLNCAYRVSVYASEEFHSAYISTRPRLYAGAVILIFLFTSVIFITYDCYVARRQRKVMEAALQRDEIVSSLFPAAVRQRLFRVSQATHNTPAKEKNTRFRLLSSSQTTELSEHIDFVRSEPIADFLPMISVVFADISGFTAWSSEREPSQVFQLLETVYRAFDRLACKCGVFKLETTGDCYVAATGVPVYQPDHAVRIVKFAYECLLHMHELVRELETTLGPGTSSLSIRIGVHSGPVIAGVLRGDKTRFQLFGDTMNTASRMQTTGEINMIQISNATADLLTAANKSHWILPRDGNVSLKGKGLVETYWADPVLSEHANDGNVSVSSTLIGELTRSSWGDTRLSDRLSSTAMSSDDKLRRIVEWNTDLLLRFLKNIIATRSITGRSIAGRRHSNLGRRNSFTQKPQYLTPIADVTEILPMQGFFDKVAKFEINPDTVEISDSVRSQLRDYIAQIASRYHDNPFHNFEHACHVAMSASKIVTRIIRPDVECPHDFLARKKGRVAFKKKIHHSTFGISSDVLMQFAVVFSAVIHDVDHTGVSNAQLVKEGRDVAIRYESTCVAEQNSVDIAWNLLMQDKYKELRQSICLTEQDLMRFRQLLVNAVIATDIADKELQQRRKKRWDRAFHCGSELTEDTNEPGHDADRKATIVFEYIIQASDVSHTMQHWKVYKQWNERLFEERYAAYQCGREEQDPSVGWYKGEIWFFDSYIIPLAKKLETCGVFGVSSDEYLSYALENRREWELKGEELVKGMVENYRAKRPLDAIIELDA